MEQKKKILVVDDTAINRALLSDMLEGDYKVVEAASGVEAVAILGRSFAEFSLVLLDIVMPEMDGFEVLAMMNRNGWIQDLPVIMISAEAASSYVDHAYDLGATDYITRPFDEKTVQRRVQNTIMLYAKQQFLRDMVTEQIMEKERSNSQMVEILSNIVEFRNGESGLHVLHIRVITDMLLQTLRYRCPELQLTSAQIALIANASAMHDIGKISIDEKILNKPGRLTKEEFEIMKTHAAIGAQILEGSPRFEESDLMRAARDICRWHHERYDGRGYPDGLKGDEIPLAAQVVALADVYDALTSARVYKPAYPHTKAVEMIQAGECGAFNPLLLECLQANSDRLVKELEVRSPSAVNNIEMQRVASELMSNGELRITSRTLALLEQERIKYNFYASSTQEILFEYDRGTDLLEFSEWGAKHLDVPTLIAHPSEDERLIAWNPDAYRDMSARLLETTSLEPVATGEYCLQICGAPHWMKVVARTLWDSESQAIYSKVIGRLVDTREMQVQLDELQLQAQQDPLTGLYNRRACQRIVDQFLQEHRAEESAGQLILLDLDSFKQTNDVYGHSLGDNVLKYVARNIQTCVRSTDVAARAGGDEFAIFAAGQQEEDQMVQRIVHAVSVPFQDCSVSASMGVAVFPQDGSSFEELFGHAEIALQQAKRSGRGCYCFYGDVPAQMR